MTIPVYRQNPDHDDWEVASVYDSDDCGSLGGSAYGESLHSSGPLDDPALRLQGYLYGDTRPRIEYPVPQQQYQTYPPATHTHPRWDACYAPGKQSSFVVPPPGVIFPHKDWVLPPQDTYWPGTTNQMASSSSDMPVDVGLVGPPSPPPLLLCPSSPPRAPSPLIKRPSPTTPIAHGQPPYTTSITVSGTGTGSNVNGHASPIMAPPPRYHEVTHAIPQRLVEGGCQAHQGMTMSPPRRSGHDVLSSYAAGSGHAGSMPRGPRSSEEFTVADGRYGGGGGSGGHPNYGPGDRQDVHPPPVPSKYEYEPEHEYDGGRTRMGRPQTRERRPSIWRRFVRRFSPSGVSMGQT